MSEILTYLHDILFAGALRQGGDWGGPECSSYVPIDIHYKECFSIILIFLTIGYLLDVEKTIRNIREQSNKYLTMNPRNKIQRIFEYFTATAFILMFIKLLTIKIKTQAVSMLLQPCHLLLILQSSALLSNGPYGIIITLCMLSPLTGALIAIAIPTLNGLTKIEVIIFYLQHYLLGIVPIYLLCRNNFAASKFCSFKILFIGHLMFSLLHFTFYEFIDLNFNVNVQFLLCPTFALQDIFKSFPPYLLYPSYRTTVTVGFTVIGLITAHIYWAISKLFYMLYKFIFTN